MNLRSLLRLDTGDGYKEYHRWLLSESLADPLILNQTK